MSRNTSRWRSFSPPSFSLCKSSTYPFRIARGVLRSCAAEASALVVRRYRSCSCEYSCNSETLTDDCLIAGAAAGADATLDIEDTSAIVWSYYIWGREKSRAGLDFVRANHCEESYGRKPSSVNEKCKRLVAFGKCFPIFNS